MKANTHPKYYPQATIRCSCGNEITVGSTEQSLTVEVCSACHPLYTGQQKLVDAAGRIDKFRKRLKAAARIERSSGVKKPRIKRDRGRDERADDSRAAART